MGVSVLVTLLRALTACLQIGMNLSPAPDLYRVHVHRSTGQLALLPLVLMVFNNHLWAMYGLLADCVFPLGASSAVGEMAGLLFTVVYCRWTADRTAAHKTVALALFGVVAATLYVLLAKAGYTQQSPTQVVQSLGYVGAAINICMYASPLATVKTVLETKSAASLPINLSCMIFLNCCMWVATSAVDRDLFVLVPSAIGVILSGVQLPLYFVYRPVHYVDLNTAELEAEDLEADELTSELAVAKGELTVEDKLAACYTVRPSCVARLATYKYQRIEGAPLRTGSVTSYASVEQSPRVFGSCSPFMTPLSTPVSAVRYPPILNEYEDLPPLMTPVAAA